MIPVFRPYSDDEEINALSEVVKSHWWGLGPRTQEFEKRFAAYIGTRRAVGVNSGTSALHLALEGLGIGPGDEVILPSMTFVSCAHSILYCGGTPVFADIEPRTMTLDPVDVARKVTGRTKAIMVVHYGGHPCDMNPISEIARAHGLPVVEDCAHSAGAEYYGRKTGGIGTVGCFSFHAVKNVATGDGGMVTTNLEALAEKVVVKRWLGITKTTWDRYSKPSTGGDRPSWYYEVDELGYKAHMNDLQAALGIVQLSRLERTNEMRTHVARFYTDSLSQLPSVELPIPEKWAKSSWHLFEIKAQRRDELQAYLASQGVSTSVHYIPIHTMSLYRSKFGQVHLPVTEELASRILTLPMYPGLTEDDLRKVVSLIKTFYSQH